MQRPGLSVATLLLVSAAAAQKDPAAGYGSHFVPTVDLEKATSNDRHLGVVELAGTFYVTARGKGSNSSPPHTVNVFDPQGKLTRSFSQGAMTSGSTWGWRDGATDGKSLLFGWKGGIAVVDTKGVAVNSLVTKNGVKAITQPIKVQGASLQVHRGVAFDPAGNNGDGSIWTADFVSTLYEIDLQGKVLRSFENNLRPRWVIFGLAMDRNDGTLWLSSAPNLDALRELDPKTGNYTGNVIERAGPATFQGGIDGVAGAGGFFGLVGVDQGPDTFTGYRVDRSSGLRGETEALMLSNVNGGALTVDSPKDFRKGPGDKLGFAYDFSKDATLKGRAAAVVLNVFNGPVVNATTPGFPELVAVHPLSNPSGPFALIPTAISTSVTTITVPAGVSLRNRDTVRMQTVYVEPKAASRNGVVPTNQVVWEFIDPEIVVVASGSNTFNSNTASGFWSVENRKAPPILELTFDFNGVPGQGSMRFDTDQTGMRDRFDGGNSKRGGCQGTYRNGSDAAVGLVYKNTRVSPCDSAARAGWVGSNSSGRNSYKTLTFKFSSFGPKKKFEFDADTDGGLGINGGSMRGMKVQVKLFGGKVLNGVLQRTGSLESKVEL